MSDSSSASFETSMSPARPRFGWAPWLLLLIAAWYFLWPVYRAFLNVEIDINEGWNAYFADAAMGRMPLYPSPEKLITNNYPPVSYYIVGGLGRVLGDPILAGRLLSLAAIVVIGAMVALAIRELGGDRAGAGFGAAFFVATISHFCEHYAGMDDPQLLAQAIMAAGFVWFLRAEARDRSCLAPILLMGFAGFLKHNIIAMPVTAFLWLGFRRPLEAVKCAVVAGIGVALGFALCFALYGRDFFANLMFSRQYSWKLSLQAARDFKPLIVALAASIALGCVRWRDRGVRVCLLLIVTALGADFLQRSGAGVDQNAGFDLIIAASIGVGLAFAHAGRASGWRGFRPGMLQAGLTLAICLRFLVSQIDDPNRSFRLLFDPAFKDEIAIREKAMTDMIAKVRATPGAVMCSNYACYRAGKPFAIDRFNAEQRMLTGALPRDALRKMIANGQLTEVESDPRGSWRQSMRPITPPASRSN
jgi:hypothetical protein